MRLYVAAVAAERANGEIQLAFNVWRTKRQPQNRRATVKRCLQRAAHAFAVVRAVNRTLCNVSQLQYGSGMCPHES